MDSNQFDRIAKTLAVAQARRHVLGLLAGTALSTGLGLVARAGSDVAAETCKRTGRKCDRRRDCCSRRCKNERCRCSRSERRCHTNSDCCNGGAPYCDLRCLDPGCNTCAPTDQPTGFCKDDSYCGGVRP